MKEVLTIRKRLLVLLKLFSAITGIPVILFLVIAAPVLAKGITPPCILPTAYHIARMHWIENRGEMEWSGEIENAVAHLRQCRSNTETLAKRLLADKSGTVASLGMDIVARESLDGGDELLRQHSNDKRWNHNLAFNDDYSKLMLSIWKMKRNQSLTTEDKTAMQDWPYKFFTDFGVVPPEGSYWMP